MSFMGAHGDTGRGRFGVTSEEQKDLFTIPRKYSLRHCVVEEVFPGQQVC